MYIDYNAELALPSVIIDMPELQRMAARKKALHGLLYTLAALSFVVLGGLIYLELTMRPREVVEAETLEVKDESPGSLKLTVKLAPEQVAGAVVEVDGEVISGNPPYVYLSPSEEYHSIKISAPGYEVMSKDVQVSASEVMTFALISRDAAVVADNDAAMEDVEAAEGDDVLSDSDFDANSDELIEEIVDDAPVVGKKNGERKRGKGAGRKNSGRRKSEGGARGKSGEKSEIRAVSVAFGPAGTAASNPGSAPAPTTAAPAPAPVAAPSAAAPVAAAPPTATPGRMTTVPAQPLGSGPAPGAPAPGVAAAAPAPAPAAPAKASLIVNAPLGVTSRVRVSVDGKMRGYLPVLLKVEPGLHELTFMTEGRRTFQMVKLNPGQIVRIIPNL